MLPKIKHMRLKIYNIQSTKNILHATKNILYVTIKNHVNKLDFKKEPKLHNLSKPSFFLFGA